MYSISMHGIPGVVSCHEILSCMYYTPGGLLCRVTLAGLPVLEGVEGGGGRGRLGLSYIRTVPTPFFLETMLLTEVSTILRPSS
jgi:hypothetical protein